jgi:G2/mitotic-specific cyclin-B1
MILKIRKQEAKDLHLIGVTSIFIACKYEELYPLKLQIVHERIAHKKLSCEEIKSKEMEILDDLDFEMMGPTFYDFVILLLHLTDIQSQVNEQTYDLFVSIVSYVSKLVVFDYDIISTKKVSLIAAGVLYVSFKIMEQLDKSFNLVANVNITNSFKIINIFD